MGELWIFQPSSISCRVSVFVVHATVSFYMPFERD